MIEHCYSPKIERILIRYEAITLECIYVQGFRKRYFHRLVHKVPQPQGRRSRFSSCFILVRVLRCTAPLPTRPVKGNRATLPARAPTPCRQVQLRGVGGFRSCMTAAFLDEIFHVRNRERTTHYRVQGRALASQFPFLPMSEPARLIFISPTGACMM